MVAGIIVDCNMQPITDPSCYVPDGTISAISMEAQLRLAVCPHNPDVAFSTAGIVSTNPVCQEDDCGDFDVSAEIEILADANGVPSGLNVEHRGYGRSGRGCVSKYAWWV